MNFLSHEYGLATKNVRIKLTKKLVAPSCPRFVRFVRDATGLAYVRDRTHMKSTRLFVSVKTLNRHV